MKRLVAALAPLLLTILIGCTPKETEMTTAQAVERMVQLASTLGLAPIGCLDEVDKNRPNLLCFTSNASATEFKRRIDELQEFQNTTGWRDDYGTLSASMRYDGYPYAIGVIYSRSSSMWTVLSRYAPLVAAKAKGYAQILVVDKAED
ncbi:hypothetical protein ACFFLM_24505 [Deinococcus oregonensis]|uniref:Lipoprotein n=1 Tax=Deinococcus oregonensis TaxID=1805970 RepID=A0ABV6B5U1_9DEIO